MIWRYFHWPQCKKTKEANRKTTTRKYRNYKPSNNIANDTQFSLHYIMYIKNIIRCVMLDITRRLIISVFIYIVVYSSLWFVTLWRLNRASQTAPSSRCGQMHWGFRNALLLLFLLLLQCWRARNKCPQVKASPATDLEPGPPAWQELVLLIILYSYHIQSLLPYTVPVIIYSESLLPYTVPLTIYTPSYSLV